MSDKLKLIVVLISITGSHCQELVVHPQNATVMLGQTVKLQCVFSENVPKCVWYHTGTDPVGVGGRYQYYDKNSNGINTSDCSLQIVEFSTFDATSWHCSIAQSPDSTNYLKSKKAYLIAASSSEKKGEKTKVAVHPQNGTVVKSGTMLLHCIFQEVIAKCVWYRNGMFVMIKDRYKYHKSTGENTKDCTIEVSRLSDIDATQWHCTCTGDSRIANEDCKSNSATLKLISPDTTTESIINHSSSNDTTMSMTNLLLSVLIGLFFVAIIVFVAIYCHRIRKAKRKEDSTCSVSTNATLQHPSGQEIHGYTYITEFGGTSVEDAMGYLVPHNTPRNTRKPETDVPQHTYEEIPE